MSEVTPEPAPPPVPTMTVEQWYAADIAARAALAEATAARHADWLAECARVQARHAADIVARTAHAQAQADTAAAMHEAAEAQKLLAFELAKPGPAAGVPLDVFLEVVKALAWRG